MKMAILFVIALAGISALIMFGYYTNWQAAVSLFFVLWANNLSQKV